MRIFRLLSAIIWAIPFYFIWNYLAPIYAPQLPEQYLNVPFWHIAGIFALIAIVQAVLIPRRLWRHRHHFRGSWTEKYYHKSV